MIEMAVRNKKMINACELFERERGDAGACVDQHVVVDEQTRGMPSTADAATASENCNFHGFCFVNLFGGVNIHAIPIGWGWSLPIQRNAFQVDIV